MWYLIVSIPDLCTLTYLVPQSVKMCLTVLFIFQWIVKRELARWLVMGVIGILTGCIASIIDIAVKSTAELKFTYLKHCILSQAYMNSRFSQHFM